MSTDTLLPPRALTDHNEAWKLVSLLEQLNPDAMLLEPRARYDRCIVGITRRPIDHWPRAEHQWVAIYDSDLLTHVVMEDDGVEHSLAAEHVSVNIMGAWVGEGTPVYVADGCDGD